MDHKAMVRKYIVLGIIFLFLSSFHHSSFAQQSEQTSLASSSSTWLYVGGNGPGNYTTIQSAIDAAYPGDTIFIYSGIYNQTIIINTNQLTLIGQDKHTTIINCNKTYQISQITINAHYCSIENLQITLINESLIKKGIVISSTSNTVKNTIITNVSDGIELLETAESNTILNNEIKNNIIGIDISGSTHNDIIHNLILNNTQYNIYLSEVSDYNTFSQNTLKNSSFGMRIAGSKYNYVFKNNFQHNQIGLYCCCHSRLNFFYTNNFVQNSINGKNDYGLINYWYDGVNNSGNYWDDYTGFDTNNDGIGDTPYKVTGGDRQDIYPLLHPFESYSYLNISLENHEVNEETTFNVTVKTLGGTVVAAAEVLFNNRTILTNSNGIAQLTAPTVLEDVFYPIKATKSGYISDNDILLVKNMLNTPPSTPTIQGETNGTIHTTYYYTIQTTDPEQDTLQYHIEWGDNSSTLTGYNESGKKINISHTWKTKGTYAVKVKAIDEHYAESNWTTLTITMPFSMHVLPFLRYIPWALVHFLTTLPIIQYLLIHE